jgi:hypothetical protein
MALAEWCTWWQARRRRLPARPSQPASPLRLSRTPIFTHHTYASLAAAGTGTGTGLALVARARLPINSGLQQTTCTECACEEWFPRPLLATAKLPAVFYASTIVASKSRKRLRSLSLTPQHKIDHPNIAIPQPGNFIITSTSPNRIPRLKCFCCENAWCAVD